MLFEIAITMSALLCFIFICGRLCWQIWHSEKVAGIYYGKDKRCLVFYDLHLEDYEKYEDFDKCFLANKSTVMEDYFCKNRNKSGFDDSDFKKLKKLLKHPEKKTLLER